MKSLVQLISHDQYLFIVLLELRDGFECLRDADTLLDVLLVYITVDT